MRDGIVLDQQEVKEIIAEHFDVKPEDVIRSQYSYIVMTDKKKDKENIAP